MAKKSGPNQLIVCAWCSNLMRVVYDSAMGAYTISHGICWECYEKQAPEDTDNPRIERKSKPTCPKCDQQIWINNYQRFEEENLEVEGGTPQHKECPVEGESS